MSATDTAMQSTPGLGALNNVGPGDLLRLAVQRKLGRSIDVADKRQLRQAAVQLTAQLFFAPLLSEARKANSGEQLGNGGRTEEVFGEQFDLKIADAVAARNPGGIVGQIAKKLAARLEAKAEARRAAEQTAGAGQSDANANISNLWAGLQASPAAAAATEVN